MIGTGIAQTLPFLATPMLTRLYSQEDFARYTSFFAVASILAVAAGGRYFLAIVLPRKDEDALRLYNLSINITLIYVLVLAFVFQILYWTDVRSSIELTYFVPLYVLFFGFWTSLINLSIRNKSFRINAFAKVYQSAGYIVAAIILGLAKLSIYGLVIAKTLGVLASSFYLGRKLIMGKFNWHWREYREVALRYADFPKYSVGPALVNTLTTQAFILFLTEYYSPKDLGYYGLTYMVLGAPLGLIGTSYKDVFYQRIAE
ncbi:MAG: lipopolysaccharide biosynthesis protein, partial [Robiginitalea sp.]